jgi:hypothetical protein
VPNIISELERLILGSWKWNMEEIDNNSFKTIFPSKVELQRIVKWGVVHTKFQSAKIKIEERLVDNEVKFVLPRMWIQFTGLPAHLHDFLIIWVVGAIMGVTKDMYMVFMRNHGISLMQVLVLNPNLIPNSVNIVIGDGLYELKFSVELNGEAGTPHPMEMDQDQDGDEPSNGKDDEGAGRVNQLLLDPMLGSGEATRNGSMERQTAGHGSTRILPTFLIQAPMELLDGCTGAGTVKGDGHCDMAQRVLGNIVMGVQDSDGMGMLESVGAGAVPVQQEEGTVENTLEAEVGDESS